MKREQRIGVYRRTLETHEREAAAKLQEADAKINDARARLEQLQRYKADYVENFGARVSQGISGPALLDFQAFIARLGDAIQQQNGVIARMEVERVQMQQRLRDAAVQNRAVGAVVERWRTEDRVTENRKEQKEIDERAQRPLRMAAAVGA